MKIAIGIAYVFIAGLLIWVFMLSRTVSNQEEKILALTPTPTPPPVVPPVTNPENSNQRNKASDIVNGTDLWSGLSKNVKELQMNMTFDKQQ